MNNIKKLIIITIAIIIVIILMIVFFKKNDKTLDKQTIEEQNVEVYGVAESGEFEKIENETMYFTVVDCLEKFLKNSNDNQIKYFMLSEETIKKQQLSTNNISEKINFINENEKIKIKDMKVLTKGDIQCYMVKYYIQENNINTINVMLDDMNMTFCIEMQNQKITQNDLPEKIEENNYNTYKYIRVNEAEMAKRYITDFKDKVVNSPKDAYDYLNEEYRKIRFKDFQEFEKYVKEEYEIIKRMNLWQYKVEYEDNYTRYICINGYGEYWIFQANAVMEYNVILDTYSIDLPEFLESYKNTNAQGKVALNVQKFFQAVNAKDYAYAYSKLDNNFKNNYFKTEQEFKYFIENNLFEFNEVEFLDFNEIANNKQYKLRITDKMESKFDVYGVKKTDIKSINFNIVMQLKEGTDFVMSFEI